MRQLHVRILVVCCVCVVTATTGVVSAADPPEEISTSSQPTPRYGHSMTTVGNDVYLFGGYDSVPRNDLWRWDRTLSEWEQVNAMNPPPARFYHGAAAVGGKLYIGFGAGSLGSVLADLWQYNPATNAWAQISLGSGPDRHYLGGMVSLGNGKVFVGGGYDDMGGAHLEAWILNLGGLAKGGVSSERIVDLGLGRYGFSLAASLGGNPMLLLGYTLDKSGKSGAANDILVWNPEPEPLGTWETITPAGVTPVARVLAATTQYLGLDKGKRGHEIWIFGGESAGKTSQTTTIQLYDLDTNTWSLGPDMLLPLSSFAAAVLPPLAPGEQAQVLMFGGQSSMGTSNDYTFLYTSDSVIEAPDTYLLASANLPGENETLWTTDLEIFNEEDEEVVVTVYLLEHDEDNSAASSVQVTIPAGQARRWSNVLQQLFSYQGSAALRLSCFGDIQVTSRTSTPAPDKAGGTYGQFVPAFAEETAFAEGEQARLIQLTQAATDEEGYRAHVGLVNATDQELDIDIDLYDDAGTALGTVSRTLDPFGFYQVNKVFQKTKTTTALNDGYAVVQTTTQGGRFFTYASVVDNITGDPYLIIPVEQMQGQGYVPVVANLQGYGTNNWHSDLELHNPGSGQATGFLHVLQTGVDNSSFSNPPLFAVDAGQSQRLVDVLGPDYFDLDNSAAGLEVWISEGTLQVTSRTFNDQGAAGTYGQFIPCKLWSDAQSEVRLIQLASTSTKEQGFRTHLGVVNVNAMDIEVAIDLFMADGTFLGQLRQPLLPLEFVQINNVFDKLDKSVDVVDGYAEVWSLSGGGGRFFAYASVVDKATGDPTYIPGL